MDLSESETLSIQKAIRTYSGSSTSTVGSGRMLLCGLPVQLGLSASPSIWNTSILVPDGRSRVGQCAVQGGDEVTGSAECSGLGFPAPVFNIQQMAGQPKLSVLQRKPRDWRLKLGAGGTIPSSGVGKVPMWTSQMS